MNILSRLKKPMYFVLVFAMLLQNTMLSSIFKFESAKAGADPLPISQITYITGAQTIDKNEVSQKIKVQTQDENSSPVNVTEKTTFNVTSSSTTGQFSRNGTDNWVSADFTFNIAEGNKQNGFYYRDTTYGVYDISVVSADHPEWGTITQIITVANTDSQSPTSKVYFPEKKSYQNEVNYIEGEAFDNVDIAKVEVKIYDETDGTYYDGNAWTNQETWHLAYLTDFLSQNLEDYSIGWHLDVSNSIFTNNHRYFIYSKATDSNGNIEDSNDEVKSSFDFDNEKPTGSILINDGADVTNGEDAYVAACKKTYPKVKLSFMYDDNMKDFDKNTVSNLVDFIPVGDNMAQMAVSNNSDMSPDGINDGSGVFHTFLPEIFPWNVTQEDGLKHVYVQFRDQAGNLSPIYEDTIFYSHVNLGTNRQPLDEGTHEYPLMENVFLTVNADDPAYLFYSQYSENPFSTTSGNKFLNQYFDFNVSENDAVIFPVLIKIYFSFEDLTEAGLNLDQVQGLYFWDFNANSWTLYANTGVTLDDSQKGYDGYVWAYIDHFTPMSLGGDVTAPNKVLNLVANAGDAKVDLKWDLVSDASKYEVRFRQSTSNDASVNYSDIYAVSGNSTTIAGLTNGIQYEFNVRSVDAAGNKSEWAIVVATPYASNTSGGTSGSSSWYGYYGASSALAADTSSSTATDSSKKETEIVTEGEKVKGEDTTEGETEGARTAVTIGIIIIAIGAALGGYYGYQWWIAGNHEEEEKDEKPKTSDNKPKPKKVNRRW